MRKSDLYASKIIDSVAVGKNVDLANVPLVAVIKIQMQEFQAARQTIENDTAMEDPKNTSPHAYVGLNSSKIHQLKWLLL